MNLTSLISSLVVLLLISCKEETIQKEVKVIEFKNIIYPINSEGNLSSYLVGELLFKLPKSFVLTESIGPDFKVLYFSNQDGINGGIYFGDHPSLPERMSHLSVKNDSKVIKHLRNSPGDPLRLKAPKDSLKKNKYYSEEFTTERHHPIVDTEKFRKISSEAFDLISTVEESKRWVELYNKFIFHDSLKLEAWLVESKSIWKSYPYEGKLGKYDLFVTDENKDEPSFHFFTTITEKTSFVEIDDIGAELIKMKKHHNNK